VSVLLLLFYLYSSTAQPAVVDVGVVVLTEIDENMYVEEQRNIAAVVVVVVLLLILLLHAFYI